MSIPTSAAIASDAESKHPGDHAAVMAIPFGGPWLEATGASERESANATPGLVALGVLQVVGLVLACTGVLLQTGPTPSQRRHASLRADGVALEF